MSWLPASDSASVQEMQLSTVYGWVFIWSFLLENILSLDNGLYSNHFTYLTEIMFAYWLILKFKSICRISCCRIIIMCNFPDQLLWRVETLVILNSVGLFWFMYTSKKIKRIVVYKVKTCFFQYHVNFKVNKISYRNIVA